MIMIKIEKLYIKINLNTSQMTQWMVICSDDRWSPIPTLIKKNSWQSKQPSIHQNIQTHHFKKNIKICIVKRILETPYLLHRNSSNTPGSYTMHSAKLLLRTQEPSFLQICIRPQCYAKKKQSIPYLKTPFHLHTKNFFFMCSNY